MNKNYLFLNLLLLLSFTINGQSNSQGLTSSITVPYSTRSVQIDGNVLHYIQNGFGVNFENLLEDIGLSVTTEVGSGDLNTLIPSQAWDLLLLQVDDVPFTEAEVDAITAYVNGGGKLILNYWAMNQANPEFQELFGLANTVSFNAPLEVFTWDDTNIIFNDPNAITGITLNGSDNGNDNGDRLQPTADANAIGGFVAAPTENEAAIIRANDNYTIYHGFAALDMNISEVTNLIENEINYLLVALLSVDDNTLNKTITLYPNPVQDILTVEKAAGTPVDRITIVDTNGRIVSTTNFEEGALSKNINTAALASGIYLVRIESATSVTARKFIKN